MTEYGQIYKFHRTRHWTWWKKYSLDEYLFEIHKIYKIHNIYKIDKIHKIRNKNYIINRMNVDRILSNIRNSPNMILNLMKKIFALPADRWIIHRNKRYKLHYKFRLEWKEEGICAKCQGHGQRELDSSN